MLPGGHLLSPTWTPSIPPFTRARARTQTRTPHTMRARAHTHTIATRPPWSSCLAHITYPRLVPWPELRPPSRPTLPETLGSPQPQAALCALLGTAGSCLYLTLLYRDVDSYQWDTVVPFRRAEEVRGRRPRPGRCSVRRGVAAAHLHERVAEGAAAAAREPSRGGCMHARLPGGRAGAGELGGPACSG